MPENAINAIFEKPADATAAIEALRQGDIAAHRFSVIGSDSDSFREVTATLQSGKVDKLLMAMGLSGAAIGCIAGFLGMPSIPSRETMFLLMVPLSAGFVGTAVGFMSGMLIGAVLKLDAMAPTDAMVRLGVVHQGNVAVSIAATTRDEADLIRNVLATHGATWISVDIPVESAEKRDGQLVSLSKTA